MGSSSVIYHEDVLDSLMNDVSREEEIQSLNNSSIQANVSSNEVVDGYSTEAIAGVSSLGEDGIRDILRFWEWPDELYLKEMGKL
ncbi:hypothetical protein LWI29_018302 [Acer saccharum]|uniref:Uncharacterized protein n=1 Tax=Acer saccharum TaxID=4024 RepID=A0AA39W3Q7_ACESA|nr:hypothetical protein LWI29_018302 [Acer saccharum]